jgi:hypothetical protein
LAEDLSIKVEVKALPQHACLGYDVAVDEQDPAIMLKNWADQYYPELMWLMLFKPHGRNSVVTDRLLVLVWTLNAGCRINAAYM